MPTLAAVIDAVPRCPATNPKPTRNFGNAVAKTTTEPVRCDERLRYVNMTNDWRCLQHGVVLAGSELVLTRAGYAVDDDGEVLAA